MCEIQYDGWCDVWDEKDRTARKEHWCSCCNGLIWPGEKYVAHFSVYDGNANYEKCCSKCDIWRELFGSVPEHNGTPAPSDFWSKLQDCIGEGDEDLVWRIARFRIFRRDREAERLHNLIPLFPIVAHLQQVSP